uniref:RING-type domain-containing protein n=1 Tax=Heliothis virescens TaxID=7102 RepID=A0A2A4K0J4_HELVI
MSVREEDRQKNSCPSRGLGIAAAAIGVGVGAALYYFFSKRPENPNAEGSTSGWNCERPQAFRTPDSDDSYTTISENETSDTSIHNSQSESNMSWSEHSVVTIDSSSEESSSSDSTSDSESDDTEMINTNFLTDTIERGYLTLQNAITNAMTSDSEANDWDVTTSSLGVPEDESVSPMFRLMGRISSIISPRKRNRERSWTLEECSICFEVMLRDQEVMSLPCSHNFHSECIMPWLQEKQTCPNCRKVAE